MTPACPLPASLLSQTRVLLRRHGLRPKRHRGQNFLVDPQVRDRIVEAAGIDRDRAVSLGVTPEQIQDALYSAYGSRQVSTIFTPANEFAVIMEVEPRYQRSPEALSKLYVRSSGGNWFRWMKWRVSRARWARSR